MVQRRAATVDQYGRVQTSTTSFTMQAVVVAASPNDLARLPDYEIMHKTIGIYSISPRLQGPAVDEIGQQTMPDLILWHGSTYVIRLIDDYSGYGRGFIHSVATSIQAVDPPPMPEALGSA